MNLLICFAFLFLVGTGIHAKDGDHKADSVIFKLNSLLRDMVREDDLQKYRDLSKEALNLTKVYLGHTMGPEKSSEETTTVKQERNLSTNSTEDEDNGARRNTETKIDAKFCDSLIHNVDVALKLVELNILEVKAHPRCVLGPQLAREEDDLLLNLDRWIKKEQLDNGNWPFGKVNVDVAGFQHLRSDFSLLASALAPGFTPTLLEEEKLESIFKRPFFVKFLTANPNLCMLTDRNPQLNFVSIFPNKKQMPLDQANLQYNVKYLDNLSPQTPNINSQKNLLNSELSEVNSYPKMEKIGEISDSFYGTQQPKPTSRPLSLHVKNIPNIELNRIFGMVPEDELKSKNLNQPPIMSSIPISEQEWQLIKYPNENIYSGPKNENDLQLFEKLKLLLPDFGETPVKSPIKLHAVPYENLIDIPAPKKPQIPLLPIHMNATPINSNEISRLLNLPEKELFEKLGIKPTGNTIFSSTFINPPAKTLLSDSPLFPKKSLDLLQNPIIQKPQNYPNHNNPNKLMVDSDYPKEELIKYSFYPPTETAFINIPNKLQILNNNEDFPKPDLILAPHIKPKLLRPANYNLKIRPGYDLETEKVSSDELTPVNVKDFLLPLSSLSLKPKHNKPVFETPLEKKTVFSSWPHPHPTDFVNFSKDNILHKGQTIDFLNGVNDGNRGNQLNPINKYTEELLTASSEKPVDTAMKKKNPTYDLSDHPIYFSLGKDNVDYFDLNQNLDDRVTKLPNFINGLYNKQKGPIDHNNPLIFNDFELHSKPNNNQYNLPAYSSYSTFSKLNNRPPKLINTLNFGRPNTGSAVFPFDQIKNPMYPELIYSSHEKPYQGNISQITSSFPAGQLIGHLKPTNPKWQQISGSLGFPGLNKQFEQNAQYTQNPFKNSYQIDDWLFKTPLELLESGGETNWIKLATSRPSQTEVELIFLMKAQEPIIYWPVHYLSYRIPTKTLIDKIKTTPKNKPILSSTNDILRDLINTEHYSAISPELQNLQTKELWKLLVNNGLVVAANIYKNNFKINDEDYLITMDKLINNPHDNHEINNLIYLRSGSTQKALESDEDKIDKSENSDTSKNVTDPGRRLLTRYFYPKMSYFKYVPASISMPLWHKLQARKYQQRLAALQLQRFRGSRIHTAPNYNNMQNSHSNSSPASEVRSNVHFEVNPVENDRKTININFGSHRPSGNETEKSVKTVVQKKTRVKIGTTTEKESDNTAEQLSVRGLGETEKKSSGGRLFKNILHIEPENMNAFSNRTLAEVHKINKTLSSIEESIL